MRALRRLGRGVAAALDGLATVVGVGPRSARRAMLDRWDDAGRRRLFPDRVDRPPGRPGGDDAAP